VLRESQAAAGAAGACVAGGRAHLAGGEGALQPLFLRQGLGQLLAQVVVLALRRDGGTTPA
jgi:hypothetical protein